jgi:signal transduction histidine kinase
VFFSRYLFSIGLPVEKWLHVLAELLQVEARPERFLSEAVAALLRVPSVAGVSWRAGDTTDEQGSRTPQAVEYASSELALTIYSRYRLGPTLRWHLHLLGQLLGEFYVAKLGEEKRSSPELQALLRRQLPLIERRLAETLEKLQRPQESGEIYVAARLWWESLARQYRGEGVEFEPAAPPPGVRLPRSLFDSVADNLIRNALAKRADDEGLRVRVALECGEHLALRVCDSGAAVPAAIAANVLRAPVSSRSGLGIGLYQAARQAEASGYRLTLESNREGEVCFALTGSAA